MMKKRDFIRDLFLYLVDCDSTNGIEPVDFSYKNSTIWLKYEVCEFFIKVRCLSKKKKFRITIEDKSNIPLMLKEYDMENIDDEICNISIDIEEEIDYWLKKCLVIKI